MGREPIFPAEQLAERIKTKSELAKQRPRNEKGDFTKRQVAPEEKKLIEKKESRKLAKYHSATAMRVLADIMNDADARPDIRVSAANSILDRAEGKPKSTTIDVEGPALRIIVGSDKAKK